MTQYNVVLLKRVCLSALLMTGLLSIQACQLTTPATKKTINSALNTDMPVSSGVAFTPTATVVETGPALAVRERSEQSRVSEKHFIIPVARSGYFAPEELDDFVLRIIEESHQWESVAELQIHGHTDSEGSELSNMLLSIRRANIVAERFEELGVEVGLLLIEAHGETQAIADNTTLDGRIANRRIEIVLIGNAGTEDEEQYDGVVAELSSRDALR